MPTPGADRKYGGVGPTVTVPLTPRPEAKKYPSAVEAMLNVVDDVQRLVEQTAAPVAKGLAWSAWTLPLLLLFLLLQNSIDARDPKLAQAPAYADPSLPFDEQYDRHADSGPADLR